MVESKDRTYIFLTAGRKAWHHNTDGWHEDSFERFNYIECGVFSKPTAELTEADRMLVQSYGEPDEDFRWPSPKATVLPDQSSPRAVEK